MAEKEKSVASSYFDTESIAAWNEEVVPVPRVRANRSVSKKSSAVSDTPSKKESAEISSTPKKTTHMVDVFLPASSIVAPEGCKVVFIEKRINRVVLMLPTSLSDALKGRAKKEKRSVNDLVISILEQELRPL